MRPRLALLGTVLLLAACGSGGSGGGRPHGSVQDRTLHKATGLPPASQVTRNGNVVPAGRWAVVTKAADTGGPTTLAVRATALTRGAAGDFKDVTVFGPGLDLDTAVGWYVSIDYAVLRGDVHESPQSELSPAGSGAAGAGMEALSVNDELLRCDPPGDYNPLPPGLGYAERGCVVVAARPGVTPRYLSYDDPRGSQQVRMVIPRR